MLHPRPSATQPHPFAPQVSARGWSRPPTPHQGPSRPIHTPSMPLRSQNKREGPSLSPPPNPTHTHPPPPQRRGGGPDSTPPPSISAPQPTQPPFPSPFLSSLSFSPSSL